MNALYLFKSLGVSIFILVAFTLSACDNNETSNTSLTEPSKDKNHLIHGDPVSCGSLPYTNVNEQLEAGMDLVYGRVEKVEPVLDAFIDVDSDDRTVQQRCDGQVTPAIRIQLRVEQGSWKEAADAPLTITLEPDALHQSEFQPFIEKDGDLVWTTKPAFLTPGSTVAFGGALVDAHTMVTKLTGVYPLNDGKIVQDFDADNRCKTDDFTGRNADELIERILNASDTRPSVDISDALYLFSSYCDS